MTSVTCLKKINKDKAFNLHSKFEVGEVSIVWEIGTAWNPTSIRNGTYLFPSNIHL